MKNEWYFQLMGEEKGPVTAAQLRALAANGTITRNTHVRRGEGGKWVIADQVQGLFNGAATQSAPPQPPPPPQLPPQPPPQQSPLMASLSNSTGQLAAQVTTAASSGFGRKLVYWFDPMFKRYLTPWIVRVSWGLVLLAALFGVCRLAQSHYRDWTVGRVTIESFQARQRESTQEKSETVKAVGDLIGHVLTYAIQVVGVILVVLWTRVVLETAIVLFNISTRVSAIDSRLSATRASQSVATP